MFGRINTPEFHAAQPPIILAKGKLAPAGVFRTGLYAAHSSWLHTRHGIQAAQLHGLTHLLAIDVDELLFLPSGLAALHRSMAVAPADWFNPAPAVEERDEPPTQPSGPALPAS